MEKNNGKKAKEIHFWGSNKGKDMLPNSTPLKYDREKLETMASLLPDSAFQMQPSFLLNLKQMEKRL